MRPIIYIMTTRFLFVFNELQVNVRFDSNCPLAIVVLLFAIASDHAGYVEEHLHIDPCSLPTD
jgi:hypothetical protein